MDFCNPDFAIAKCGLRLLSPCGDGSIPPATEQDTPEAKAYAGTTATVITDASHHFNRGQRAFFFAFGYLGWFLDPLPLFVTTAGILVVQWRRQFASLSQRAVHGA